MEQFVNMHTCFSACQIPTKLSTVNFIHCDTAYSWQHYDKNLISYLKSQDTKQCNGDLHEVCTAEILISGYLIQKNTPIGFLVFLLPIFSWSERYINKFGKKSARLYLFNPALAAMASDPSSFPQTTRQVKRNSFVGQHANKRTIGILS